MRSLPFLISLSLLACGCALRVKGVFEPVGLYGAPTSRVPIVAAPRDVQVFMHTSPDGFTLTNNELEVQAGYGHQILGTVAVKYAGGFCADGSAGQRDLVAAMQEAAWSAGGNAVIHARSAWDEDTTDTDRCQKETPVTQQIFASGWVVALSPGPSAPSAP